MFESYSFGKHAVKYIKKNRYRIECIYISVWPLLAQYLIAKISNRYSIPSVIHVQDIYPESLSNKIRFFGDYINKALIPLDKYILNHVSLIVAISENMRSVFKTTRAIPPHKIIIVRNWHDEGKFVITNDAGLKQAINTPEDRQFTFMYLGNNGPVAGVDFLIKSFIKADLPGALLVIAGSGSQKEKCMQIANIHKNSNIVFTDVPSGKVPEMQDSADVLLLPVRKGASLSSIPSKLPAYMFSKKPIIACVENDSDIALAIRQSECGWIVNPEDTDSLILAMKTAISSTKKDLLHYGENGFNYAMENFSKEKNLGLLVSSIIKTFCE